METVSVVIVSYNRVEQLGQTLAALVHQTRVPDEVFVVDNGSTAEYASVIERFRGLLPLGYVKTEKLTIPAGRNIGIRRSQGSCVAFVDDDCIPHACWLERLIKPFEEDPTIGEVGGDTRVASGQSWFISAYLTHKMRIERAQRQTGELKTEVRYPSWPYFATSNAAIRRAAFEDVGFFDELCITGEDVDMSVRLNRSGWRLWCVADAYVDHAHRETFRELLRQRFSYGVGHPYLFEKHELAVDERSLTVLFYGWEKKFFRVPFSIKGFVNGGTIVALTIRFCIVLFFLICLFIGVSGVLYMAAVFTVMSGYLYYISPEYRALPLLKAYGFLCMGFAMRSVYIAGGGLSGLRRGMIFIE